MRLLLPAALLLASPAFAARTICWKATSLMWDAAAGRAVPTSPEMLERLRRAFGLWEKASGGALRFAREGADAPGYDGTADIPFDGCVHAVLHGERNFHGELAHGGYDGEIPGGYRRGYFFVSRRPGAGALDTLAHEIGHALGLPHAGTPESILFSGPRAGGSAPQSLSAQDGADLRARWLPPGPGNYTVEGTIASGRAHRYAVVSAVPARGGRAWSARSDHQGKFLLALGEPGEYRLVARPVTVARDLNADALGGMRESWYVSDGRSVPDPTGAAALRLSDGAPRLSGLRLRTLDTPAPARPAPAPASESALPVPGPLEGSPRLRLSFDSGFDDEGPAGLKAAAHGDELRLVPGLRGQALFVGGTEDWLDLDIGSAVPLGRGFSLELWFRREDWENPYRNGAGWQTIAALTTGASLSITAPGCPLHRPWAVEAFVSGEGAAGAHSRAFSKPGLAAPGRWMHAAAVYDPAERSLSVYVDGQLADRAKGAPAPDSRWKRLRLGTWHKANQAYRGAIDELLVYDYPRSPEEIARAAGR